MLSLKNINKSYLVGGQSQQVLFDINVEVNQGDYLAIMGRSGSGKSTLMNIIGLIDTYDDGVYIFDKQEVGGLNEQERTTTRGNKIGFVFQSYNLIPKLALWIQVSLPLFYQGVSPSIRKQKAIETLKHVGLSDMYDKLPNQLSGGQQQRVAIARAIISNPEFILADEPTGALDTTSSNQIMDIFDTLNKEGKTIIMITHDDDVAKRANQKLYLKDGKVVNTL